MNYSDICFNQYFKVLKVVLWGTPFLRPVQYDRMFVDSVQYGNLLHFSPMQIQGSDIILYNFQHSFKLVDLHEICCKMFNFFYLYKFKS